MSTFKNDSYMTDDGVELTTRSNLKPEDKKFVEDNSPKHEEIENFVIDMHGDGIELTTFQSVPKREEDNSPKQEEIEDFSIDFSDNSPKQEEIEDYFIVYAYNSFEDNTLISYKNSKGSKDVQELESFKAKTTHLLENETQLKFEENNKQAFNRFKYSNNENYEPSYFRRLRRSISRKTNRGVGAFSSCKKERTSMYSPEIKPENKIISSDCKRLSHIRIIVHEITGSKQFRVLFRSIIIKTKSFETTPKYVITAFLKRFFYISFKFITPTVKLTQVQWLLYALYHYIDIMYIKYKECIPPGDRDATMARLVPIWKYDLQKACRALETVTSDNLVADNREIEKFLYIQ